MKEALCLFRSICMYPPISRLVKLDSDGEPVETGQHSITYVQGLLVKQQF